mgnify:CR=1 FL=1
MSMSNAAEAALLDLLFLNTDWANVGDAAGLQNSAAAGSFYIALHTADPDPIVTFRDLNDTANRVVATMSGSERASVTKNTA